MPYLGEYDEGVGMFDLASGFMQMGTGILTSGIQLYGQRQSMKHEEDVLKRTQAFQLQLTDKKAQIEQMLMEQAAKDQYAMTELVGEQRIAEKQVEGEFKTEQIKEVGKATFKISWPMSIALVAAVLLLRG